MGILLNLTKEYFKDEFRNEDMGTTSDFLEMCIKNKKISTFISKFKDWNDENYLVYNGESSVDEVKVMSESEARTEIIEQIGKRNFGYVALSKQILNANLNFYRKNTKNYDKMPENVKKEIDKIFRLSIKCPEFISTYLLLDVNSATYSDRKSPCEISIMEASDISETLVKTYKECIIFCIPKGMTNTYWEGKFYDNISPILKNLRTSMENNYYKPYHMDEINLYDILPYDDTYLKVFLK